MTPGEVRVSEEGAGQLGSTPLPVSTVKLDIAEVLANGDGVFLTWERDLEDDLSWTQIAIRHPELRALGGESRRRRSRRMYPLMLDVKSLSANQSPVLRSLDLY